MSYSLTKGLDVVDAAAGFLLFEFGATYGARVHACKGLKLVDIMAAS